MQVCEKAETWEGERDLRLYDITNLLSSSLIHFIYLSLIVFYILLFFISCKNI